MKYFKVILLFFCLSLTAGLTAQNTLDQARIYINPGHGGWWSEDRNLATINHALRDTTGFYETNTNLIKGLSLRDELTKAGAGFIKMSRTKNGIYSTTSTPSGYYAQDTDIPEGTVVDGVAQIVTLAVICADVETNNMDYFISIHSNAATEGTSTNYPLVLYRGTDAAVGNGLTNAKNMGVDAWKWINDNGATYKSAYTAANTNNVRGDMTFMNGQSTTTPIPGGTSYTGYYGVLRHGCDGYLVEGCFHTYQPERQRLLNPDYCRQEGLRYARAIRAWFGDNTETKGGILGTVKDKYQTLEHNLYHYKENSMDAYKPLNEVTVVLQDANQTKIAEYTTDKEYNGVYSFPNLTPGIYYLVYDIAGYWKETVEIEVTANKTSFINKNLTDLTKDDPNIIVDPVDPEVIDYPHPNQDGDVAAADLYNFKKEYELTGLAALQDLTIRRAILRDGKYYVLAVDAAKNPKLLVLNPVTGELIKEMSTAGIVTTGYNGKAYPYILSDIAFTADGVLLGANSTVVGKAGNAYQTGDFYLYKWQATTEIALEDATPAVFWRQATNDDVTFLATGFNNSNFMANSIAVNGNLDNFKFYFDSHAGNDWTTSYNLRLVCWIMKNGVMTDWQYNESGYTIPQMGEDVRMTLSPLKIDQIILDGNKIAPREFKINWDVNQATLVSQFAAAEVPVESTGATYFRYVDKIYMSTPVCEKTGTEYAYKSYLYDITAGLDKAEQIGTTDAIITGQPAVTYMTSAGVVDNADIDQYLLVGNNIVKYTTKGVQQPLPPARIFAYNLNSVKTASGYDISYTLNEAAKSVELILTNASTGAQTLTDCLLLDTAYKFPA
ncbi:hypothetical protein FACS1894182_07770 [Bacteroidia bacterium]|nr:hypothetical protein FACS1894182_07770 [Bacteroidia bacterium]